MARTFLNLGSEVGEILPVSNGGTSLSSLTAHGVLLGDGTSAVAFAGPSSLTYSVLVSQGLALDPLFLPVNAGSNITLTTGTGGITIGATGGAGGVTQLNAGTGLSVTSSTGNVTVSLSTPVSVANGGTGDSSLTIHNVLLGEGTGNIAFAAPTSAANALVSNGASSDPSFQTLPVAGGGTGQITASAAFNTLSPITSTGDLILGNGTNSATRLNIGSTGQVLTVSAGTAGWSTPSTPADTTARLLAVLFGS